LAGRAGSGDKFGRARGFGMRDPCRDPHRIVGNIWIERDSEKGIIIRHGGSRRTDVGTRARVEIEQLLGQHVYFKLRLKVAKEGHSISKQLGKRGL